MYEIDTEFLSSPIADVDRNVKTRYHERRGRRRHRRR